MFYKIMGDRKSPEKSLPPTLDCFDLDCNLRIIGIMYENVHLAGIDKDGKTRKIIIKNVFKSNGALARKKILVRKLTENPNGPQSYKNAGMINLEEYPDLTFHKTALFEDIINVNLDSMRKMQASIRNNDKKHILETANVL